MPALRVSLFGRFTLSPENREVEALQSAKAKELPQISLRPPWTHVSQHRDGCLCGTGNHWLPVTRTSGGEVLDRTAALTPGSFCQFH
jgi:hypothetical protein